MKLELSPYVEGDLDEIGDYIARDNPGRAVTFVGELIREIQELTRNPLGYRVREDIGSSARVATFGKYLILFRVTEDAVWVERVVHGNRRLRKLYGAAARGQ